MTLVVDGVFVVRLGPKDWSTFKAIRLEALRLEPAAFSSTFAETQTRPDESWQQWLENPRCLVLVAMMGKCPVGIVGAYRGSDESDERVAVVFGMYVNGGHRRQGVGQLLISTLLDSVSAWSALSVIRLWVRADHEPARRLYESFGFLAVGREAHPHESDGPPHEEIIMEKAFPRSSAAP